MSKEDKQTEWGGIGHNRGPAIDQKPLPESDKLNLVGQGKSISDGAIAHGVEAEDYSSNSTADLKQPGARCVAGFEAKWAVGYTKVAGKHVAADGLVSKRGYARILPEGRTWEGLEGDLDILKETAKQVLTGHYAALFEKLVIEPLSDGTPRPPVEDVAAQLNVTPRRAYKILAKCWNRVSGAAHRVQVSLVEKYKSPVPKNRQSPDEADRWDPKLHYSHREHDRWPWPEVESDAAILRYAREQTEKWENTYGVNRPYGPKRHGK